MNTERQIYLLNPKKLSPETIAVTFAKTSRSPQSFREIAAELTDESSAQFHEKWVVGYGHSSVAEHAVLHIAVENVSRLAVETIESNRLASYTEKSTRYQKWNPDAFYIPPELTDHPLRADYISTCRMLFSTYLQAMDAVRSLVMKEKPRQNNENESTWERRIRTDYIDVCRYLLPASSLANLGMTINARALEHGLQKMLSSPLAEVQEIGDEIKSVAQAELPTLIKYADRFAFLDQVATDLTSISKAIPDDPDDGWCKLVSWDVDGEDRILAAALYRFGNRDYDTNLAYVKTLDQAKRLDIAKKLTGMQGFRSLPVRELEHTSYSFDLVLDQGAYFEVKRHRMATQTPQNLTTRLGYAVPRRMVAAGFKDEYCRVMDKVAYIYEKIAEFNPAVASYVVPNGFNRRVLFTLNLREAFHFCSLRSTPTAHFAVRRVALRMAEMISSCHPVLAACMQLPEDYTWQSITNDHFSMS